MKTKFCKNSDCPNGPGEQSVANFYKQAVTFKDHQPRYQARCKICTNATAGRKHNLNTKPNKIRLGPIPEIKMLERTPNENLIAIADRTENLNKLASAVPDVVFAAATEKYEKLSAESAMMLGFKLGYKAKLLDNADLSDVDKIHIAWSQI